MSNTIRVYRIDITVHIKIDECKTCSSYILSTEMNTESSIVYSKRKVDLKRFFLNDVAVSIIVILDSDCRSYYCVTVFNPNQFAECSFMVPCFVLIV